MGLSNLLKTGNIVNKDFAYYEVPFRLDPFDQKAFYQSGVVFKGRAPSSILVKRSILK